MKMLAMSALLLVGLTINIVAQDTTLCHGIVFYYNESMDNDVINASSYTVRDTNFNFIDVIDVERIDTSTVVLYVPAMEYRTLYIISAWNVHDVNGNLINPEKNSSFVYFDGYSLNEPKPFLIVR